VIAPASFDGSSATITVTATNANNETSQQSFVASAVTDTHADPPFLSALTNLTTTAGAPVTFNLSSTDPSRSGVVYSIVDPTAFASSDPTTLTDPANVTVSISQSTGQVTLTPTAGFTGTINLLATVRTAAGDPQNPADDATNPANYDTQAFSLTVNPSTTSPTPLAAPASPTGLAVDSSGDTAPFDGNGYITTDTPKITLTAEAGATVNIKLNGTSVGTATESTTQAGQFSFTLPTGKLAVGANSLTAIASDTNGASDDSTALSLMYAPDYSGGIYVVPGAAGATQTLTATWTEKNAAFNNEFGYFVVDSADGSVGGVAPGSSGYVQAALSSASRTTLFAKGDRAGATKNITLQGGQRIVFYLIQNNTTANFLAKNPTDAVGGNNQSAKPLAFFSLEAANPDRMKHVQIIADATTGKVQYNWEDMLKLGDSDFNDAAITIKLASNTSPEATLHVPGTGNTTVSLNATLTGKKESSPDGDFGVYFADDQNGTVNGLHPGDAGYAAAALASGNTQVLFAAGADGSKQITLPAGKAGKYVGFYLITSGTTANFLTSNPTNTSTGAQALFSFDAANPDGVDHFRWFTPGTQQTDPSVQELHVMDKVGGKSGSFDAYTIDLAFAS
jgi:hypothetical protein